MQILHLILIFGCAYSAFGGGGSQVEQSEDGSSGTISFSTPDLSDDESHSPWMPDQLKCDACVGIAYQLWEKFDAFNKKRPSQKYKLSESDILDITESLCTDIEVTWQKYGMKEVKKVKRLSGPGLDTEEVPGITAQGGKWPSRMAEMCDTYMGELGEDEVYKQYKKDPTNSKALEKYLCKGSGLRGECSKKKSKSKTAKIEL